MFCCVRPDLSPGERMVHDILKEFHVRVEPLEDSTSAHCHMFVHDNYVYKYEALTDAAILRNNHIDDMEASNVPHIIRSLSKRVTKHGIIRQYEYCKHGDLFHLFSTYELDWDTFDGICMQMVRKLHDIHCNGMFHNDIKPENIFVTEGLDVIIGDVERMSTAKKRRYGTDTYESPMHGMFDGYQADLYALGKTIMVCLHFVSDTDRVTQRSIASATKWLTSKKSFASFTPCRNKWVLFVQKATVQNEAGFNHSLTSLLEFLERFEQQSTHSFFL